MENVVVHIISHSHWDRDGIYLWKSPDAIGETFLTIFLISLKMILNLRVSAWMDKPLSLMTVKCLLKTVTRCSVILTEETKDWTFPILQDDYLISSDQCLYLDWSSWMCPNGAKSTQIGFPVPWEYGTKLLKSFKKSGIHIGSLWPCEAGGFVPSPREDEQFTSVFEIGRVRTEVVFSVSTRRGIVMR